MVDALSTRDDREVARKVRETYVLACLPLVVVPLAALNDKLIGYG